MRSLKVLLVDDNAAFLRGARELVAALPQVASAACAASGAEALARVRESPPDLVLTDLMMPEMSGFELIHLLHALPASPRLVAVSLHETAEFRCAARRSGAEDLIAKREFQALIPGLIASAAGVRTSL